MIKLTKRMRFIRSKIDRTKQYEIKEALILVRELSTVKFIESVDVAINLGIDSNRSDQNIRGAVTLPHGTGRNVRIAVFTQENNIDKIKNAGADLIVTDNLVDKIKQGNIEFDLVIASPDAMHIVSKLGHILGPRGLMPNSKLGTITPNITEAVKKAKSGQIYYRNDKNGIIHSTIGRVNYDFNKLKENLEYLLITLKRAKPTQIKGTYIKKISLSTTMGIGITVDQSSLST